MMKNRILTGIFLLLASFLMMSGCAVNRATAQVDPSADLSGIEVIYVKKLPADSRGIHVLIADKLNEMGYRATTGEDVPPNIDAVVSYKDKWMWDLTMYMLELSIIVRDPKNDFPLASGNSYHTSLTRKSPEEMVDEVLTNILTKAE